MSWRAKSADECQDFSATSPGNFCKETHSQVQMMQQDAKNDIEAHERAGSVCFLIHVLQKCSLV